MFMVRTGRTRSRRCKHRNNPRSTRRRRSQDCKRCPHWSVLCIPSGSNRWADSDQFLHNNTAQAGRVLEKNPHKGRCRHRYRYCRTTPHPKHSDRPQWRSYTPRRIRPRRRSLRYHTLGRRCRNWLRRFVGRYRDDRLRCNSTCFLLCYRKRG